ncbi:hypothetical protein GGI09_009211, partial [Coemansia sp. S100]
PAHNYNYIVEPLTRARLGEIRQDAGLFRSTWEKLCERYQSGNTDFAPLTFTGSCEAVITSAGTDTPKSDLNMDEGLGQVATMAAYVEELIGTMLNRPKASRSQI